ncbi:MAG: serine/threonine protein kinase [Gammaproteobacteria bacterium]|nr:serine/threonine protein kinase [Gammaproteobacteria bacterium]
MNNNRTSKTAEATLAYQSLGPEQIMDAVETQGYVCDGRLLALNSYENRVYQVGLEDTDPIIAKFYRPNRWTDEAIQEEHDFAWELVETEIPVIAPLKNKAGKSLHNHHHFRFALFERCGGRPPELDNVDHLEQLGRFLGRIHVVGKSSVFMHRPALTIESFGEESYKYVLNNGFIPKELETAYRSLAEDLLQRIQWCYERAGDVEALRLHGDCHPSNILWTEDGPHIVDLDDSRTGPAAQDLWMFLSGDRADQTQSLDILLEGYTEFCDFNARDLHLIEALRTLRMIYYHAWLARRWDDPAFPRAFPWFNTQQCWEQHILDLREQAAMMNEAPLTWMG